MGREGKSGRLRALDRGFAYAGHAQKRGFAGPGSSCVSLSSPAHHIRMETQEKNDKYSHTQCKKNQVNATMAPVWS
jgi:hypothetical protein